MNINLEEVQGYMDGVISISKKAGEAILNIYQREDFGEKIKSDNSPLTEADLASHHIICDGLKILTPLVPILSEESKNITYEQRQDWETYWLVDPLDGTKEFIARNDEFTTNIALVHKGRVILGVIYVPVFDTYYFASKSAGAFKKEQSQAPVQIKVRKVPTENGITQYAVVASRRHGLEQVKTLCKGFDDFELKSRGSSLKMCLVAEGEADLYPRLAPTSEWDTAASQIIVEEAGGQLVKTDFSPLLYNTKESLLNPHFLVLGDPSVDWKQVLLIE